MLINGVFLKKQTLWLIGAVAAGSLTVQQEWVKDHIIPLLANHPHLSTLGGPLLIILSLLHQPAALKVAGDILAVPTDAKVQQNTTIEQKGS